MQRHPLHIILGRPAIHILLALAFTAAFFWPIFAMTRPTDTFHSLYTSWLVCLVVLFIISRAVPVESSEALQQVEQGSAGGDAEDTQESL